MNPNATSQTESNEDIRQDMHACIASPPDCELFGVHQAAGPLQALRQLRALSLRLRDVVLEAQDLAVLEDAARHEARDLLLGGQRQRRLLLQAGGHV